MNFTLVSTIFNESKRLQQTISDLEQQTIIPSEIIITDAGSSDGTWEMLQDWKTKSAIPILLLREERCNVARGRNLAIAAASNEIIVSTDFGCRFHPNWLESLMRPFENADIRVVGGAFTVKEVEIVSIASKANYLLTNGYKIDLSTSFIPSSRSIAYYKSIWKSVGGYCEWLTLAADDLVFGMQIRSLGIKITLVNEPYVYWGRHLKISHYNKEAFRYGLGDGEANVNYRNFIISSIEFILRIILASSIIGTLFSMWFESPLSYIPFLFAFIGIFGFRPYINVFKNWVELKSSKYNIKCFLYSFLMLEEQRYNYIKGYLKGYFFASASQKQAAKFLHTKLK